MADSLVTVASFWFIGDADVAKSALDAAGIESFVDDQSIARLDWFYTAHGVRLRVRNEDALRANEVLGSQCRSLETIEEADEEPIDPTVCPYCGAPNATRAPRGIAFAVIGLLAIALGVALTLTEAAFLAILAAAIFVLIWDRWHCGECGASWN